MSRTRARSRSRWRAAGLLPCVLLTTSLAVGLGADGAPIDTSDYTVDFYEGPVLQSSRVIGLAGSVAAVTEGVSGFPDNPASAALRVPWSNTFFDWELAGSVGSPSLLADADFDNNGSLDLNGAALFATLGVGLQWGTIGLGLHIDVNQHPVGARGSNTPNSALTVSQGRINLVAANLFMDGQLALGIGYGIFLLDLAFSDAPPGVDASVASVQGNSIQLGGVWAPQALPLRVGVSARVSVPFAGDAVPGGVAADAEGNYVAQGFYLPRHIDPPTVIQAAVSTQFFRRLNGPWSSPPLSRRQRPTLPPEYTPPDYAGRKGQLQITVGGRATLPVQRAVGLESFLRQEVERSGQRTVFSPRLGIEAEPWINGLILRGGSYFEPSRFDSGSGRLHGTVGLDIHIPVPWTIFGLLDRAATFRLGGALDRAPRYFGWSASLGLWH